MKNKNRIVNSKLNIQSKKLRENMTPAELKFSGILDKYKINYYPQHPFQDGLQYYILDFYLPDYTAVIEIDGYHHSMPHRQKLDEVRTERILKKDRYSKVIRIKNEEVFGSESFLMKKLLEELFPWSVKTQFWNENIQSNLIFNSLLKENSLIFITKNTTLESGHVISIYISENDGICSSMTVIAYHKDFTKKIFGIEINNSKLNDTSQLHSCNGKIPKSMREPIFNFLKSESKYGVSYWELCQIVWNYLRK